jgi:hypothetical protein
MYASTASRYLRILRARRTKGCSRERLAQPSHSFSDGMDSSLGSIGDQGGNFMATTIAVDVAKSVFEVAVSETSG